MKSARQYCVTIEPNSSVTVQRYVDKAVPYHTTCALLHATPRSKVPRDLDIVPYIVNFEYPCNRLIPVQIENVTTRTITISPKAILCELQSVKLEEIDDIKEDNPDAEMKTNFKIDDNLPEVKRREISTLLNRYQDVFSHSYTHTSLVQHKIELTDEMPFKLKPRRIPPSMYMEIKNHLNQSLDAGLIISKSP